MMTAKEIIGYMESLRDEKQRQNLMRFFKTGPGEYGEGDEFLGLKVPQTRQVVKLVASETPLSEVPELLMSRWHEVRLCGLLIMVEKFAKLAKKKLENDEAAIASRDEIVKMYLQYAERANNWDLVDLSAPKILGYWLLLPTHLGDKRAIMDSLASSPCLWKQRISMVSTWKTTQQGDPSWCLRYAEWHLHHPHDLMHKAVGWMLREVGKRGNSEGHQACLNGRVATEQDEVNLCGMDLLRQFLECHAHEMPRTALRYAIEQMPDDERKHWMALD